MIYYRIFVTALMLYFTLISGKVNIWIDNTIFLKCKQHIQFHIPCLRHLKIIVPFETLVITSVFRVTVSLVFCCTAKSRTLPAPKISQRLYLWWFCKKVASKRVTVTARMGDGRVPVTLTLWGDICPPSLSADKQPEPQQHNATQGIVAQVCA